jgi:hypothetical protein
MARRRVQDFFCSSVCGSNSCLLISCKVSCWLIGLSLVFGALLSALYTRSFFGRVCVMGVFLSVFHVPTRYQPTNAFSYPDIEIMVTDVTRRASRAVQPPIFFKRAYRAKRLAVRFLQHPPSVYQRLTLRHLRLFLSMCRLFCRSIRVCVCVTLCVPHDVLTSNTPAVRRL